MEITDGVFRSTYTTPTFVQPVHGSVVSPTVSADALLKVYSPNGRFTLTLGDLTFPSATTIVIPGGLPLAYSGYPTCMGEYHYTKIYATYEKYSKPLPVTNSLNLVIDGVTYVASAGTLRKA